MIAGLVLAGGQASRMGGLDKPLLPLGGRTILDHLLDRLRPQIGKLAISANGDPARYAAFNLPILPDGVFRQRGPLGGVLSGLVWAAGQGADALLTVPGDTPFIPTDLAERLAPAPACAEDATAIHWPVALWPIACAAALTEWLATQNSGRVSRFAEIIQMRRVTFDGQDNAFHNVNTKADLEAAQLRV